MPTKRQQQRQRQRESERIDHRSVSCRSRIAATQHSVSWYRSETLLITPCYWKVSEKNRFHLSPFQLSISYHSSLNLAVVSSIVIRNRSNSSLSVPKNSGSNQGRSLPDPLFRPPVDLETICVCASCVKIHVCNQQRHLFWIGASVPFICHFTSHQHSYPLHELIYIQLPNTSFVPSLTTDIPEEIYPFAKMHRTYSMRQSRAPTASQIVGVKCLPQDATNSSRQIHHLQPVLRRVEGCLVAQVSVSNEAWPKVKCEII